MPEYRDPAGLIARLRRSGHDIVWAAELFPPDAVDWAPPGEWSARQIVTHLRDMECAAHLARLHAATLEDDPSFPRADLAAWRAANRPPDEPFDALLADFLDARHRFASTLERLDADDWDRPMRTVAFGRSTVEEMAERALRHTLDHQGQLMGLRRQAIREGAIRLA